MSWNPEEIELERVKAYIDAINFKPIINKLVRVEGWMLDDALKTCELYRNFLYLIKKYAHEELAFPPSEDIDEFWHAHILDTEQYAKDCEVIFGKFLHHYPYVGLDGQTTNEDAANAFAMMQALHLQEFGYEITPTRSMFPSFIYALLKRFSGDNAKLAVMMQPAQV